MKANALSAKRFGVNEARDRWGNVECFWGSEFRFSTIVYKSDRAHEVNARAKRCKVVPPPLARKGLLFFFNTRRTNIVMLGFFFLLFRLTCNGTGSNPKSAVFCCSFFSFSLFFVLEWGSYTTALLKAELQWMHIVCEWTRNHDGILQKRTLVMLWCERQL